MTIEQAQKRAKSHIATMAENIDPISVIKEDKRIEKVTRTSKFTLEQVFNDYLAVKKSLKPGTIKDYERIRDLSFELWKNKSLKEINRELVTIKHNQLGRKSQTKANNAMRVLRALFNFAIQEYIDTDENPIFTDNPVQKLSHNKAWFIVERRRKHIKTHELESWFKAVLSLEDIQPGEQAETVRDHLILLILTGLRREEAARLQWDNIDFDEKTLTVIDTKNREPHILPLSDYIFDMLDVRYKIDQSLKRTPNIIMYFLAKPAKVAT